MTVIPMSHGLILGGVLFALGLAGLALLLRFYRLHNTLDADSTSEMRG